MKKQFCLRGHDISVVGRYACNGTCKQCALDYALAYEKARGIEWTAAKRRRTYQQMRKDPAKVAKALASSLRWNHADPERARRSKRKSYEKYKGVNFWVVAASKSR